MAQAINGMVSNVSTATKIIVTADKRAERIFEGKDPDELARQAQVYANELRAQGVTGVTVRPLTPILG